MNYKILSCIAMLLIAFLSSSATTISYSKDVYVRNKTFRIGTSAIQGQAIRIPKAKLQALRGKSIKSVDFVVGTKNTTNNIIHGFISTSIDSKPSIENDIVVTKPLIKTRWTLEQPYVVSGDETELFIGYIAEAKGARPLVTDASIDIRGCNYVLKDSVWTDTYGMGKGSACIYLNVDDNVNFADLIVGRYDFGGYYKAGNNNVFTIDILNAGTQVVNEFDAIVNIDEITQTYHFNNLDIQPHDLYSLHLNDVDNNEEGSKQLHITIANVNSQNADIDMGDNDVDASLFFYPHNMERSVLVENFTGQGCAGCPNGHKNILKAIDICEAKTGDKIVEITHHSGYYVDIFTTKEDEDFRFFYPEPNHTFAPGVMANRITSSVNSKAPVMDAVYTDDIVQLIDSASAKHPMASLSLQSTFDKETRELKLKFQLKPHEPLPASSVFNVVLLQDSISAYQNNGGEGYRHNRTFRQSLTGDSFGLSIQNHNPGEITTWETSLIIPNKIHSSLYTDDMLTEISDGEGNKQQVYLYTSPNSTATIRVNADECDIEAIPDDMTIVAYVAEYDKEDNTKNQVFNSIETKVGSSHIHAAFDNTTNVKTIRNVSIGNIRIADGRLKVDGEYDKLYLYNSAGIMIDSRLPLNKGVYIVKVVKSGECLTKKLSY